jgi:hypothetical protein
MASPSCDPCPQPCPQQVCTTRYVQRCYYQPVTTYKTTTFYEPVTTYRTSYFYEPVTTYRYSCFYDPCTCRYQQVATPCTSYRLRSQCCPVTSYLQRCALQPVTTYQQVNYLEPQTTCCTTTTGAPIVAQQQPPVVQSGQNLAPVRPAPSVTDQQSQQPPLVPQKAPGVSDGTDSAPSVNDGNMKFDRRSNPFPATPRATDSDYRQPELKAPIPGNGATPTRQPNVRPDKVAAFTPGQLGGQVVNGNDRPLARVRVMFISADAQRTQRFATTDDQGQFRATLTSGGWLVYVYGADGQPVFQQKVDVNGQEVGSLVKLVNR